MEVKLKKQPQKYLKSADESTRKKLYKGIDDISEFRGDIKKLAGKIDLYRYKIAHYRIIFEWTKGNEIIIVETINTRTNIKY
jgi:Cytotoxic translational repressor of toxin-antitoxin stability system